MPILQKSPPRSMSYTRAALQHQHGNLASFRAEQVDNTTGKVTAAAEAEMDGKRRPLKPKFPKPHQPRRRDGEGDLSSASSDPKYYFVEIFYGCGSLSAKVHHKGATVHLFDIIDGKSGDIMDEEAFRRMRKLVASPNCIGVWFGMPCETFSAARNGKDGGPGPIRDPEDPMKPHKSCTPTDRTRVLYHNKLVDRMVTLITIAEKNQVR